MIEKEKTAYHEGGHCFRAWKASILATHDTCMMPDDHGNWWGRTPVRRTELTEAQRAEIALAGLLAEAKAIASEDGGVLNVATSDALAASIAQLFIDHAIPVAGPGFELDHDDVYPLQVSIEGEPAREANVTRSDLVEVPAAFRSPESIKTTIDELALFLNKPVHWAAVDGIAKALLHLGGGCLGRFMIYCVIRTATDSLLESVE